MEFSFSRDECLNLENSLCCEWLETNGLGGYAAGTILDCHTRKYHGLLAAPLPELNGRFMLLSKVETLLRVHDQVFRFSTNKYPGVFHPTGHKYLEEFRGELYPVTLYRVGDSEFRRSLLMVQGEHTVLLKYELLAAELPLTLELQPLLAYRNIHELTRVNPGAPRNVEAIMENGYYKLVPGGNWRLLPPLYLNSSGLSQFRPEPHWSYNLEYLKERNRGYEYQEDLFCPGSIEVQMKAGDSVILRASLSPPDPGKAVDELWEKEVRRRRKALAKFKNEPLPIAVLKSRAGRFFLAKNSRSQPSLIAGYPWFGERGRDALISLAGLTHGSGRHGESAMRVLRTFAGHEQHGLLPDLLPAGGGEPSYDAVDPALWFFWAVQEYLRATGDLGGIEKHLSKTMRRILEAFAHGRAPHVTPQDDGLIWIGAAEPDGSRLTWMDARIDGRPATPRYGLVVEINALWYNALAFFGELCEKLGIELDKRLGDMLEGSRHSFVNTFWRDDLQYLADMVNEQGRDEAIRPNQIFAVSLPYSPLNLAQQRAVVNCVAKNLLTPYGLRSLSPGHPGYCPEYRGPPAKRDAAYHQGTVWPWLLGHFTQAYLAVAEDRAQARETLKTELAPLFGSHLCRYCLGGISEIFNGDPPYTPKGCFNQAWSVAEVIRAWNLLYGEDDGK